MTSTYPETWLSNAQAALGEAFDCAVNACGISGADFASLFCMSSVAGRMENGEAQMLVGKSGAELVADVLLETMGKVAGGDELQREAFGRSVEYWVGWSVAYYQWRSGRRYAEIFAALPFDIADVRVREHFPETNLKRLRTNYGCSQAELSRLSGVSLRSIQMYEQRNKDINKASAETVHALSRALGCWMEDLLER